MGRATRAAEKKSRERAEAAHVALVDATRKIVTIAYPYNNRNDNMF